MNTVVVPQLNDLMSALPPGVDPETYRLDEVSQLLEQGVYLPFFSVPNPTVENRAEYLPLLPFSPIAVAVKEQLHRFALNMRQSPQGVPLASNQVAEPMASVSIRWTPIPEQYEPSPAHRPPATLLNPFRPQRFTMLDGEFRFNDAQASGFKGFGAGRTFPVRAGGERRLRIGAVVDILEGFGQLHGVQGAVVVNGFIQPPQQLALSMVVRLMNLQGDFPTSAALPTTPLGETSDPDPTATFLTLLGEVDRNQPVRLRFSNDGQIVGSEVYEILRLVDLGAEISHGRIQASQRSGPVVGSVSATLHFNPLAPTPVSPIRTTNGQFHFVDRRSRPIGSIQASMLEGRALATELPGSPLPVFRFGGFGPISGGSGCFRAADGMMSMNSVVSVFPRTLSNLYVLRLYDPHGRFRERCSAAWS